MSAIIPFEGSPLPAHLQSEVKHLNDDLLAHAGAGFPIISIKGKTFAVVRDGERKVLRNPKDPTAPATSINVVVVKANKGMSKNYYAGGYEDGTKKKPDCWSGDGVAPDRRVEHPQSKTCATCPQNAWGSKISDAGKKVKACQDTVRIAVSTLDNISNPYLLRVPPASIRPLGEYGKKLQQRGVGYNMVVTNISFDIEQPTPQLIFNPIGFLPEELYQQVKDVAELPVVKSILGLNGEPVAEAEVEAAVTPAPAPALVLGSPSAPAPVTITVNQPVKAKTVTVEEVKAAVQKAAPAPAPAPAATAASLDLAMEGFSFDDL